MVAILALAVLLLALLAVPGGSSTPDWMAFLPVLFAGLLVPFTLAPRRLARTRSRCPRSPERAVRFERPRAFRRN